MVRRLVLIVITTLLFTVPALADKGDNRPEDKGKQDDDSAMSCVSCHKKITPNIVTDW